MNQTKLRTAMNYMRSLIFKRGLDYVDAEWATSQKYNIPSAILRRAYDVSHTVRNPPRGRRIRRKTQYIPHWAVWIVHTLYPDSSEGAMYFKTEKSARKYKYAMQDQGFSVAMYRVGNL